MTRFVELNYDRENERLLIENIGGQQQDAEHSHYWNDFSL